MERHVFRKGGLRNSVATQRGGIGKNNHVLSVFFPLSIVREEEVRGYWKRSILDFRFEEGV